MTFRFSAVVLALALPVAAVETAYAQQPQIEQVGAAAQSNLNALVNGSPTVVPTASAEATKGSPYADNRWLPARLRMTNKIPLAPVPLKYDVLNQRLLMRPVNRPNDSLQLDDRLLAGFELEEPALTATGTRKRTFRRFTDAPEPTQRTDYVEVLHEGKYTLLKRYGKALRKADFQGAYSTNRRYDEIEDKTTYYLRHPNGTLVPVKLTLKSLQAAAPELASALKAAPKSSAAKTDAEWSAVLAAADK
ncbi:hypothetical protein HNQ93_001350 [Hymenobacter luteus]|uniref:Uncharacterized protein n=2 Tax=Hymenobacter TaxID=89966 RepID=A0A7W9T0Y0_9BACT|nr:MULTISPECIES: hypothetical protein [Hymenobacter]MBB4601289.1 hypothetical protein [Hymenobacter latericoloratus]MBB6058504.1 hypothetical protein [Hymenobacter luteus]